MLVVSVPRACMLSPCHVTSAVAVLLCRTQQATWCGRTTTRRCSTSPRTSWTDPSRCCARGLYCDVGLDFTLRGWHAQKPGLESPADSACAASRACITVLRGGICSSSRGCLAAGLAAHPGQRPQRGRSGVPRDGRVVLHRRRAHPLQALPLHHRRCPASKGAASTAAPAAESAGHRYGHAHQQQCSTWQGLVGA